MDLGKGDTSSGINDSVSLFVALNELKKDYRKLYQEYDEFQSMVHSLVQSEVSAANEKVTISAAENEKIRAELEKDKFNLEASSRELIRENSSLHCEIRTLRSELDEGRANLQEKTVELNHLKQKIDETSLVSKGYNGCQDQSHVTLNSRLKAAEARNAFLALEIQTGIKVREGIHQERNEMSLKHGKEVEQLSKQIPQLQHLLLQQRKDFEVKYSELEGVITAQQACIRQMEGAKNATEDQHHAFSTSAQAQMKQLAEEALAAISGLEAEKCAVLSKNHAISDEMYRTQESLKALKEEIQYHQKYSINMCNQALTILQANPTYPNSKSWIASVAMTDSPDEECNTRIELFNTGIPEMETGDGKLLAKLSLKKLITAIRNAKDVSNDQQERLHCRIQELEQVLVLDKVHNASELEKGQKKCKLHTKLIRKLRKRISILEPEQEKNAFPTKISPHQENGVKTQEHDNSDVLLNKHVYFLEILKQADNGQTD